jgi:hypothetical protein
MNDAAPLELYAGWLVSGDGRLPRVRQPHLFWRTTRVSECARLTLAREFTMTAPRRCRIRSPEEPGVKILSCHEWPARRLAR